MKFGDLLTFASFANAGHSPTLKHLMEISLPTHPPLKPIPPQQVKPTHRTSCSMPMPIIRPMMAPTAMLGMKRPAGICGNGNHLHDILCML